MTEHLQRLFEMAARLASSEAVAATETGFSLVLPVAKLDFFATGGHSAAAYCRAKVAGFGAAELPPSVTEAALRGNFFWRGTDGGVLSLNAAENAVYLTDRFDEGAFAEDGDFQDYLNGFLRTLHDWRARWSDAMPPSKEDKEVQPW